MSKIPIACTLNRDDMATRVNEWHTLLAQATTREANRVMFPRALARDLADVVAREVECCAFFTFTMTVTNDAVVLAVDAPAEGQELVEGLLRT